MAHFGLELLDVNTLDEFCWTWLLIANLRSPKAGQQRPFGLTGFDPPKVKPWYRCVVQFQVCDKVLAMVIPSLVGLVTSVETQLWKSLTATGRLFSVTRISELFCGSRWADLFQPFWALGFHGFKDQASGRYSWKSWGLSFQNRLLKNLDEQHCDMTWIPKMAWFLNQVFF